MTTTIHSNGSKWFGEEPDPIEKLLERLEEYALDPRFETYGNFVFSDPDPAIPVGATRFFGNFFELSGVFNIDTDDADLVESLTLAIRQNQRTPGYREAKEARRRDDEARERREAEQRAEWARRRRL